MKVKTGVEVVLLLVLFSAVLVAIVAVVVGVSELFSSCCDQSNRTAYYQNLSRKYMPIRQRQDCPPSSAWLQCSVRRQRGEFADFVGLFDGFEFEVKDRAFSDMIRFGLQGVCGRIIRSGPTVVGAV